jgi:DNA polymerase-3 subunit delta'
VSEPSTHIPYPWQQGAWQRIQQQIAQNKIPHALLLSGQQGIGKWHFAQSLADYLLCASPKAELACGQCRSCQLLLAQTHPDKKVVVPEEPGKAIKIEQIRQLSNMVSKTAQQGGRKVILLGPVEQLNSNSANALLKSLEEPAGDTVLILFTHVQSAVMATIRSRCQLLPMSAPSTPVAREWLAKLQIEDSETLLDLAGGAPLIARDMVDGDYLEHLHQFVKTLDALTSVGSGQAGVPNISVATDYLPISLQHLTQWWLQIVHSLLAATDAVSADVGTIPDEAGSGLNISLYVARIQQAGRRLNKQWLFKFSDKLLLLRQQQLRGANPNMQLLIEELLLDWQVIVQRS